MQGLPPRKFRRSVGAQDGSCTVAVSQGQNPAKRSRDPGASQDQLLVRRFLLAQEDAAVQCLRGAALARVFEQVTRLTRPLLVGPPPERRPCATHATVA